MHNPQSIMHPKANQSTRFIYCQVGHGSNAERSNHTQNNNQVTLKISLFGIQLGLYSVRSEGLQSLTGYVFGIESRAPTDLRHR